MSSETQPIPEVLEQINADQERAARSEWIKTGILILLCLFVIGYMSWLRNQFSKLTPEYLTQTAAEYIERELPRGRPAVEKTLKEAAPQMAHLAAEALFQAPKEVRLELQAAYAENTRPLMQSLSDQLGMRMNEAINLQLETIERTPGRTNRDKVDLLLGQTVSLFREKMDELTDTLYADYSAQMRQVRTGLLRLQSANNLTANEKLQKQLIQATVALLPHYKADFTLQLVARPAVKSGRP